ncbi:MAG: oxidoreductase [Candidatus Poribacteria bacterium]|nr:MAG: oxidoreductase [Candidatus Poribacteria bacterium]
MADRTLRGAIFGAGFWARYQIAGWKELEGVELVALYNRTREKAERLAEEFGIPAVYDDPERLIRQERPDFVDIVTDVDTHPRFVFLAAEHRVPVICQKPIAPNLELAERMVQVCREAGVPFFIHENWRWQRPLREVKRLLNERRIGRVFRGRIQYSCSFPVFENQPFLKELDQFILTDIGSHILDVARFLFGEARSLYCQIHRVHPDIRGEDVATVMMRMGATGTTVVCEMSYASRLERERFPETFLLIEGERGSIELGPDYWVRLTTEEGTFARRYPPPRYAWADPDYGLIHASIVDCHRDLLRALQTGGLPETDGADNLKTARLFFGAYDSAREDRVLHFEET